jgi:hypothetical protein
VVDVIDEDAGLTSGDAAEVTGTGVLAAGAALQAVKDARKTVAANISNKCLLCNNSFLCIYSSYGKYYNRLNPGFNHPAGYRA